MRGRTTVGGRLGGWALNLYVVALCLFALFPIAVLVVTSFSEELFVRFPPREWGTQQYVALFDDDAFWSALGVSVFVAAITAMAAAFAGTLAALALVRSSFTGKEFVRAILLAGVAFPGALIGVGTLQVFSQREWNVAPWGLLLAHLTTSLPFFIGFAIASLSGVSRRLEWAGQSLGAGPFRTFMTVTLPIIAPGIVGGAIFVFIHSFDETDVSLFTATGGWTTLPVKIFHDAADAAPTTTASSGLLAVSALLIVILLEWRAHMVSHLLSRGGTS